MTTDPSPATPSPPDRPWRRPGVLAAALALLTMALYWPATGNEFVLYDDDMYVTANPRMAQGLTGENVAWAFRATAASNWHPLTWLSHLLDAELFGLEPAGHHATSVVLHGLTAALLFLLLQRATGATGASLATAVLFAVHPLNVQSVAWISERKNLLSTLFWLLALGAYGAWTRRTAWWWYAGALGAFALSLMAKPMAVTLPFTLLLLDYWPLGRWSRGPLRLVLEKLPFFALAAASSVVTYKVQFAAGSVVAGGGLRLASRLANGVWSYLAYVGYAVWPSGLAAFYPHLEDALPTWRVALAGAAIVGVSAALWWLRERLPAQLVGWLWYLGTLVPVIGIVQVGTQSMADRYLYVPLIGLFAAVAWTGSALVARGTVPRQAAAVAAAVAAAALAAATLRQVAVWHDTVSLFEHTIRAEPRAWVAHYNLGNAYEAQGRHEDAITHFRETVKLRPEFARAYNNLGNSLDALGRHAEAVPTYERAVQLKPDLVEAYNNLGIGYAQQGKMEQGLSALRTATVLRPDFLEAHLNLAITLRQMDRLAEAKAEADLAVALRPDHPLPRYHRGLILARQGERDAATRDLQVLQGIDPSLAGRLQAAIAAPPAESAPGR
jgi:tetratricopeptide (TPR) repeat protein